MDHRTEKRQFTKFLWNYKKRTLLRKIQKDSWICLRSIIRHCESKRHVSQHVLRPHHFHKKNMRSKNFFQIFIFFGSPQSKSGVPNQNEFGVPNQKMESPKTEKEESPMNLLEFPKTEKGGVPNKPTKLHDLNIHYS